MNEQNFNCYCQTIESVDYESVVTELDQIWNQCPALNQVFIPTPDDLNRIKRFDREPNNAYHRPFITLALERGYLKEITSPIHKYLLEGNDFSSKVANSYRNRFKETWFTKPTPDKRQITFKKQIGSVFELLYAEYLEHRGYEILSLEAWGGMNDITSQIEGENYDIEVKYIGQNDDDFRALVMALDKQDGVMVDQPEPQKFHNYLVTRIYEGSKQLDRHRSANKKRVALVIDPMGACHPPFWDPREGSRFNLWSGIISGGGDQKWQEFYNEVFLKQHPEANSSAKRREMILKLDDIIILKSPNFKLIEMYSLSNPSRSFS